MTKQLNPNHTRINFSRKLETILYCKLHNIHILSPSLTKLLKLQVVGNQKRLECKKDRMNQKNRNVLLKNESENKKWNSAQGFPFTKDLVFYSQIKCTQYPHASLRTILNNLLMLTNCPD